MTLLTHVLACLFGMVPECWHLPSYLTVLIQMANVGPLFLDERPVIYSIDGLGVVATFLLAFFWKHTVPLAGATHSVPLLVLCFLLSVVDCTSSVTFLPFMMRLGPQYLTTYFVGESVSGLVPAVVPLVQGGELQANFSAQVFFLFFSAMMVVCLAAFLLLNHHPAVARERKREHYFNGGLAEEKGDQALSLSHRPQEEKPMISSPDGHRGSWRSSFRTGFYSGPEVAFIFVVLAWVNALTNAVLPSVQSYSCMAYGNQANHLAATMAAVANTVACFIAMFLPLRSLVLIGLLTIVGTGFGTYIMAMAALSPCPLLVHSATGTTLIVSLDVVVLTLSYVKVIIGVILRDEGHSTLVWCGAVVQLGSMFPLVSVYELFKSGDRCNTKCTK
uniref:Riboflavin transporter n=1 Tax=Hucho hucho TaxID=62062 RepID=A0A4W5P472_9TELE